jgi:flagellar motility protein MotE (MotC chaperone)
MPLVPPSTSSPASPASPASLETNQTAQEPLIGTSHDLARENANLKLLTERLRAELANRDEREERLLETIEKQAKLIQSLRSITSVDDGNLCIRLLPLAKDNL